MAARKNKQKSNKNKKEILNKRKLLKNAGFLSKKHDLRKQPTKAQIKTIESNYTKYRDFVSPKYANKKVSKKQLKTYKDSGYLTVNGRVFVNKEGFDRVYFGNEHILKTKNGKKKKDYLIPPNKLLDTLEKEIENATPAKKGDKFITVKIGDNGTFGSKFADRESLQNYIQHTFKAFRNPVEKAKYKKMSPAQKKKDDARMRTKTKELIGQMQIVEIDHDLTSEELRRIKQKPNKKPLGKLKNVDKRTKSKRI